MALSQRELTKRTEKKVMRRRFRLRRKWLRLVKLWEKVDEREAG